MNVLIAIIVHQLNLNRLRFQIGLELIQKVFELSITIRRWSVADYILIVIVGNVTREPEVICLQYDFLKLVTGSYDDIGQDVVRLLSIGDAEGW